VSLIFFEEDDDDDDIDGEESSDIENNFFTALLVPMKSSDVPSEVSLFLEVAAPASAEQPSVGPPTPIVVALVLVDAVSPVPVITDRDDDASSLLLLESSSGVMLRQIIQRLLII
jgi:hypothetical protein